MRIHRVLGAALVLAVGGTALAFAGTGSTQQGGGQMSGMGNRGGHMGGNMGSMGGKMQGMQEGNRSMMSGPSDEQCDLHGGQVAMMPHDSFETTFEPDGMRVYCYTDDQRPMRVGDVRGTATLQFNDGTIKKVTLTRAEPEDGDPTVYFCPTDPKIVQDHPGKCGNTKLVAQDFLQGKVNLTGMEPGSVKAVVHMRNLGGDKPEETFTEAFQGFGRMQGMKMAPGERQPKGSGGY